MEETIKNIEVIAYKGMEYDMTCRDFQYEIGKTYKTDKVELCNCGFHACLNPRDVLNYYSQKESSRYYKVKLSGEITKCYEFDTKVAATEITILEEINIDEIINNTEWWKNENVLDLLYWSEGFARVKRVDGQYNFIDKDGRILSKQWFSDAHSFNDGLARVERGDELWNFIDKKGKLLSNEWFSFVDNFYGGLAIAQKANDEWCQIDKTGKLIKE